MINFLLDLPNFLVILTFIAICYTVKLIPAWLAIALGFLSASPFFINEVIFPASYMPDQFRYLNVVRHLRSFDLNHGDFSTVAWAGWMFAFFPLPLVETVKSLGFFNRFAATALIVWLYSYKNIKGWPLLFLLFYPSFLLYSSLSLRDTLIFTFMILSIITYIDRKILLFIILLSVLFFIKFQNVFLILFFAILHEMTNSRKLNAFRILFFATIFLTVIYWFQSDLIDLINYYRFSMYIEDGGEAGGITEIPSLFGFVTGGLWGALHFLLKPLPWQAENAFQIIQSIENIFLFFLLFCVYVNVFLKNRMLFAKWFVFCIVSFMVYDSVVFNFGTAARYKFPFVMIVVIGVYYELKYKGNRLPASVM
jgi:hypothetical protein